MRARSSLRRLAITATALTLLAFGVVHPVAAQGADPSATPAPNPVLGPTPIPTNDIATRAGSARDLVRNTETTIAPDDRLKQIQQAFPDEKNRIVEIGKQTEESLKNFGQVDRIKELEKASVRSSERLDRWMRDLSTRSGALESTLDDLQAERQLWELTRDQERTDELPEALTQQISEAIETIRSGEDSVRSARDTVLALQAGVAQEQSALNDLLARQRKESSDRSVGIFTSDSPPLWRAFGGSGGIQVSSIGQMKAISERQLQDVRGYIAERGFFLLTWLLLWAGLAVTLILLRRKAMLWVQQDRSLATTVAVLDRPLAAAAVIILVVGSIVDMQAPTAWFDVINLMLLLTIALLLFRILGKNLRPIPYLMIPLFVLLRLVQLSSVASVTHRLWLLALALAGILFSLWFLRILKSDTGELSEAWLHWVTRAFRLAILLLAVGLLANITGSVRLGEILVIGTVDGIFTAIVLVVLGALLRAMVRVALLSAAARRLGIAPDHSDTVRRALFGAITLAITILWVVFTLKGFMLYDPAMAKIGKVLQASMSIGEFSLSLGKVLTFVFIIWLSVKLAALVDFVLEVIILRHVTLPVGVPQTISRLSRYIVILVGVVVAFSAIGFDLGKTALVAGGLGVGIGFGLQNIVNNFVSGLILLFERPIRIGDTIELGAASGVVEKIGLRATLIRTWRGPELVVPNADLISSSVLNWTLMRDRRRIEIPVGVDYESDPETVATLLIDIAADHPEVLKHPEPACLFLGFGDSSLDFQIRAWADAGDCLRIESELRFAISRALKEAGITIPFPQRDVHVKRTTPEPSEGGAGESARGGVSQAVKKPL